MQTETQEGQIRKKTGYLQIVRGGKNGRRWKWGRGHGVGGDISLNIPLNLNNSNVWKRQCFTKSKINKINK